VLDGRVDAGSRRELRAVTDAEAEDAVKGTYAGRASLVNVADFAQSTYFARLAHSPFTDACGVEYELEEHTALVFGVFEEEKATR
jgi:hypothetical protein